MKNTILFFFLFLSSIILFSQIKEQSFSEKEKEIIIRVNAPYSESYQFDNSQINNLYKDIFDFEREKVKYNNRGIVLIGIGTISGLIGLNLIHKRNDCLVEAILNKFAGGALVTAGAITFISSTYPFAKANSKKRKQLQKIKELETLF